jgi:hypothetical protein
MENIKKIKKKKFLSRNKINYKNEFFLKNFKIIFRKKEFSFFLLFYFILVFDG